MTRALRAVVPGEVAPAGPPKSLVEATGRSRREFLVKARRTIAKTIDDGVPAHALGRLIGEMDRLDSEIRRLDSVDEQEAAGHAEVEDGEFDSAAV